MRGFHEQRAYSCNFIIKALSYKLPFLHWIAQAGKVESLICLKVKRSLFTRTYPSKNVRGNRLSILLLLLVSLKVTGVESEANITGSVVASSHRSLTLREHMSTRLISALPALVKLE